MKVSPEGFAHMTHMLSVLANGKLVLALEGGYNVDSIVKSAHACVEVLVGDEPRYLKLESASMSATNVVQEVIKVQSKYWKCMGFAAEGAEGKFGRLGEGQIADRHGTLQSSSRPARLFPLPVSMILCIVLRTADDDLLPMRQSCSRLIESTTSTMNTSSSMSNSPILSSRSRTEINCWSRKS